MRKWEREVDSFKTQERERYGDMEGTAFRKDNPFYGQILSTCQSLISKLQAADQSHPGLAAPGLAGEGPELKYC